MEEILKWLGTQIDKGFKQVGTWINDAANWTIDEITKFLDLLFNMFIDLLNYLLSLLADMMEAIIQLFPADPTCDFPPIPDVPVQGIINFINWVLPVDVMACVTAAVVASWILYFTVGRVLKVFQVL